ncbi:hypothetical protein COCOBI_06-2320 [Coccomyxa sp. Obi]|nr:hypothetical protein COCOBI_06-2320 [Coccomyxa sp. Obi]
MGQASGHGATEALATMIMRDRICMKWCSKGLHVVLQRCEHQVAFKGTEDVATEGASASTEAALSQLTVTDSTKSAVLQTTQSATYFVSTASGMLSYSPNGTVLDGNDFSNFLMAAHKNSAVTGVRLASGSYQVLPFSTDAHIYFFCSGRTAAFEVDITGSALYFTDASIGGILIDTCNGVTLHGPANLTYIPDQWPYTQGTILNITSDNLGVTIKIHAAFLAAWQRILATYGDDYAGGGVVYENGLVLPPYRDGTNFVVYFPSVVQISNDTYSMALRQDPGIIRINDTAVITQPTVNTGIAMNNCINVVLMDLTMFFAAGFGFYDGTPKGTNTLLRVALIPDPTPGPDGQLPLMSAIHDGYHSTSGKAGPIISSSQFVGAGDDAIAIHGRMYTVAAVSQSSKTLTLAANIISTYELNVGDTINVYNPAAKFLGTATISSFTFTSKAPVAPSTPDIVFGGTFQYYNYYLTKVTSWPSGFAGMPFNSFITVPSRNGMNYKVTNNYISNNRGHGVVTRASGGTVSGNTIVGNSYGAIELAPTFNAVEGAFIKDTVVSNNVIRNEAQGINLYASLSTDHPILYPDNTNVQIINNQITGPQFGPLGVGSAATITVSGNRFLNVMCSAFDTNTRQYNWEIPNTPMQIFNVNGITLTNNTFAIDSNCAHSVANYAQPIYLVNVTNVVGVTKAAAAAVSSFQAVAPGPAGAAAGAAAPGPAVQRSLGWATSPDAADVAGAPGPAAHEGAWTGSPQSADMASAPSAQAFPAAAAGGVLAVQDSARTLT